MCEYVSNCKGDSNSNSRLGRVGIVWRRCNLARICLLWRPDGTQSVNHNNGVLIEMRGSIELIELGESSGLRDMPL